MKYNIVLATSGLKINGNTDKEQALGGSETAFINVAREFAKKGHYVRVFCECDKPGIYDGVIYNDIKYFHQFLNKSECDILIVSRHYQLLGSIKPNSKLNILWNHDVLSDVTSFMSSIYQYDYMYCLSNYHRDLYKSGVKEIDDNFCKLNVNGVDTSLIPDLKDIKKEHKIMYTSRPERGLSRALDIYEKNGDKDLEFVVCTYLSLQNQEVSQIEKLCSLKIKKLIEDGYNIRVDSFNKEDLYKELSTAKALLYPSTFPEIFCIAALEAQLCGTPVITQDDFALPEIVTYDKCKSNQDYLEMLQKVIENDGDYAQKLIVKGLEKCNNYTWENVALRFLNDAEEYFIRRATENREGILKRLLYNNDYILLQKLFNNEVKGFEGYFDGIKDNYQDKVSRALRFLKNPKEYKGIYEEEECFEKAGYDELKGVPRLNYPAHVLKDNKKVKTFLDYGCHNGIACLILNNERPDIHITGYDVSEKVIVEANKNKDKSAKNKDTINFISTLDKTKKYDAIFIGEVLEHVLDPRKLIDELEGMINPGGKLIITLPKGAWEYLSHEENEKRDVIYHVTYFDYWDIYNLFKDKKEFSIKEFHDGRSKGYYDEPVGNYLINYTVDHNIETGEFDHKNKLLTSRPYQTISACIIARDAEKHIEELLDTIHFHVDEIIIGVDHDEGECDELIRRIEQYYKVKWFYLPKRIVKDKWGFANARNATVEKATSEWILWVDTDEKILNGEHYRKFLDTPFINSYVIPQHHPQLDNFTPADKPQRVFRRSKGRFVGYIHEQVQDINDINEGVSPALVMTNMYILNFGEIHERQRRNKALGRNMELLQVDVQENVDKRAKAGLPIRKITIVLLIRDFLNRINFSIENSGVQNNRDAKELSLPMMVNLYNKYLKDEPEGSYFKQLGYDFIQSAKCKIGEYEEVNFSCDGVEYKRFITKEQKEALKNQIQMI